MKKISLLALSIVVAFFVGWGIAAYVSKQESSAPGGNPSPSSTVNLSGPSPGISVPPVDPIAEQVGKMSLEEKIGQLVLAGIDGTTLTDEMRNLIQTRHVGGLILYKPNITSTRQTVDLLNALKKSNANSSVPLFLSIDEEGGRVSRLPSEFTKLPTNRSIGKVNKEEYSYFIGQILGDEMSAFGFNVDFAPVLDIDSNPNNPVIGDRSFGRDAQTVSSLGVQTAKGIQSKGVVAVGKHFPGHGDTSVDSHLGLPIVNYGLDRLRKQELVPFRAAADNGIGMIMVAHILLPQIDGSNPASFSKPIITDLLRNELGYQGVVITDDMTMGAVTKNYDLKEAAVRAVSAGADIVLVGHGYDNAAAVLDALRKAVEQGQISQEKINESVSRIVKIKSEYHMTDDPKKEVNPSKINQTIRQIQRLYQGS